MPKKVVKDDEEDEESWDDEELEEEEEDPAPVVSSRPQRLSQVQKPHPIKEKDYGRESLRKAQAHDLATRNIKGEPGLKRRYVYFNQQQVEGIADAETNEVIASDVWGALTEIIERLDRIEVLIGNTLNE